jgi:ribose transport system ATP-binding protein
MPTLSLKKIHKSFGPTVALDGVDLELRAGEVHAVIGENGAGKSTLMNVIAGSLQPDDGSMELDGHRYTPANPLEARTQGLSLIHQELSLCPHLSVAENVMMGIESSRHLSNWGVLDREKLHARTSEVLQTFQHADIRPDRRVGDLSVAAQQIVEISRAIAARAQIILMDEPTSSLQREDVAHLFALIRKLTAEGISVVYISHFLEEVRQIADRFTVLRDGRSVATGEITSVSDDDLIAKMVGRAQQNLFPTRSSQPGETILEVQNLASPPLLKNASFTLRRGEILGIAGLMGSGRTPLLRAIFGLDHVASGTITIDNKGGSRGTPAMRLIEGLGYLSEDRKGEGLTLNQSLADNITVTRLGSCSRLGWLDLSAQRKQTEQLVSALKIKTGSVNQPVGSLSGGNQQKVSVARLLHQDAGILLLDEPTRGIDIGSKAQVYETIAACAARNKAVLMVSSYLPELFGMCDRLGVMNRGTLSEVRPIDQWTPESVLQTAIAVDQY